MDEKKKKVNQSYVSLSQRLETLKYKYHEEETNLKKIVRVMDEYFPKY